MTRQSFGVQVHRGAGIKVRRDRRIPTISLAPCPTCGAAIGERCRTAGGDEAKSAHPTRRRMAIRAQNEQVDLDALRRLRAVGPGARRVVRKAAGVSMHALAEQCGTTHMTLRKWENGQDPAGEAGSRYATWVLGRLS